MNEEFQASVSAALVKQNEQISNLQNAISSRDVMLSELLLKVGTLQVEQHTPATASSLRKTPKKRSEKAKSTTFNKTSRKLVEIKRTPSNQPNPKANQRKLLYKRSPHQLLLLETPEGFLKTK
ncbi:hypothetical protein O181_132640, partial [Austropuccinia psidii MF-1]|nr:hypothetical protein [Austropuccinia psidii MF-1]